MLLERRVFFLFSHVRGSTFSSSLRYSLRRTRLPDYFLRSHTCGARDCTASCEFATIATRALRPGRLAAARGRLVGWQSLRLSRSWTPRTIEPQGVYGADSPSCSRLEGIIGALRGALEPASPRPIAAAKSVLFGTRSASLVYRRSGNRLIASHRSHEGSRRARLGRGGSQARASYYECPAGPAQLCHRRCARRAAFKTSGRTRRQRRANLIARNPRRRRRCGGRGHQGQRLLAA